MPTLQTLLAPLSLSHTIWVEHSPKDPCFLDWMLGHLGHHVATCLATALVDRTARYPMGTHVPSQVDARNFLVFQTFAVVTEAKVPVSSAK